MSPAADRWSNADADIEHNVGADDPLSTKEVPPNVMTDGC